MSRSRFARRPTGSSIRTAANYSTSSVLAVLFLVPTVWTMFSSVHGKQSTTGTGNWGLNNYQRLIDYGSGLPAYLLNTAVVAVITVAVTVLCTTLGGYAIARFSFPG